MTKEAPYSNGIGANPSAAAVVVGGGSNVDDKEIEMSPLVSSSLADEVTEGEGGLIKEHPNGGANPNSISIHQDSHGMAPGTATSTQVAINIFISFVGAGMLGMPYAFSRSGWVLGIIALGVVSLANVYAMLMLVECRKQLLLKGYTDIHGYGDVGRLVAGPAGERLVNICLVVSQIGFVTAYIIFIAANINNIANVNRAYVCFGCIPILAILVQFNEMKTLSPFSLIADVANLTGLTAVLLQDYNEYYHQHDEAVKAFDFSGLLYVAAISIYSMEGVGLVLSLESSCADRNHFRPLLIWVVFGITLLMAFFGTAGYFAFASQTLAPITLNLNGTWATFVKLALCLALYLTYPIMLFPIHHVLEDIFLGGSPQTTRVAATGGVGGAGGERLIWASRIFRLMLIILTAIVAYTVPDFGDFLGLVGSSICTILGFILPCYFHLCVFEKNELRWYELALDYFLIVFGVIFGALGTYDSFKNLFIKE